MMHSMVLRILFASIYEVLLRLVWFDLYSSMAHAVRCIIHCSAFVVFCPRHISSFMHNVPFPSPQRPRILVQVRPAPPAHATHSRHTPTQSLSPVLSHHNHLCCCTAQNPCFIYHPCSHSAHSHSACRRPAEELIVHSWCSGLRQERCYVSFSRIVCVSKGICKCVALLSVSLMSDFTSSTGWYHCLERLLRGLCNAKKSVTQSLVDRNIIPFL